MDSKKITIILVIIIVCIVTIVVAFALMNNDKIDVTNIFSDEEKQELSNWTEDKNTSEQSLRERLEIPDFAKNILVPSEVREGVKELFEKK